jgi:MYXO-CTERM domain-containing protein
MPATAEGFALVDDQGAPVPVSIVETPPGSRTFHVRPNAALLPGRQYRLRYPEACEGNLPSAPKTTEHTFTTGPAASPPASIGTVKVTGHRVAEANVGSGPGWCFLMPLRAGLTHVEVQLSEELKAYGALTTISTLINGRSAPVVNQRQEGANAPLEMDVYAHCAGDAGMSAGLPPGTYQLEIRAHVLGIDTPPPPVFTTIELACEGGPRPGTDAAVSDDARTPEDAGGAPDAGTKPADAGTKPADAAASDAKTTTVTTTTVSGPGCSCRVGAGEAMAPPLAAGALLAGALLTIRRRRRR